MHGVLKFLSQSLLFHYYSLCIMSTLSHHTNIIRKFESLNVCYFFTCKRRAILIKFGMKLAENLDKNIGYGKIRRAQLVHK